MTSTSTLTHTGRIVSAAAIAVAVIVAAFGSWFHGAGTALAPEPAILRVALGASTGMTAAAVYLNSSTPTTVRFYSSVSTYDPSGPAAGTPCSTVGLAKDRRTTQVIVVPYGNYRKCL